MTPLSIRGPGVNFVRRIQPNREAVIFPFDLDDLFVNHSPSLITCLSSADNLGTTTSRTRSPALATGVLLPLNVPTMHRPLTCERRGGPHVPSNFPMSGRPPGEIDTNNDFGRPTPTGVFVRHHDEGKDLEKSRWDRISN